MSTSQKVNLSFGEFVLRPEALVLERNGARIRLQIQQFRVLELLVERAGEIVTRDELRDRIWPSNVLVDFDHGLNNAVTRLREALGDSASTPRYIETLHRIGYRFIYPVEPVGKPAVFAPENGAAIASADHPRRSVKILAGGAALFAIALFAIILLVNRDVGRISDVPIQSIAVLPFRDVSGAGSQDYLAAGMTEALITRLAQNQSLRVVSQTNATRYLDTEKSIAEIASELQVDGVVDGSVVRVGDDVRVEVRLVRAADESYAWAQSYERSMSDVFTLQRELANDISEEINAGLGGKEVSRGAVARSDNVAAYDLYLQGRHLRNQRSPESVSQALDYFQRAIQLDPDFAAAYAGVAHSYAALGGRTAAKSMPADVVRPAAMKAARRGIELNNDLAEAHVAMASVLSLLFPRSVSSDIEIENEYILALQLDPASVAARHGYAMFLANRRRSDEAIVQFRQALLLDPLSASIAGRLGVELIVSDQIDEGLALIRRAVEIEPWQFNVQLRLGWACATLGQFDEANKAFAAAEQISPNSSDPLAGRGYVAGLSGNVEEATAALAELQARAGILDTPFLVAIVYVGLRDSDGALKWLKKAAIAWNIFGRDGLFALDSPVYDWLREDPRFEQVRQAVDASVHDVDL